MEGKRPQRRMFDFLRRKSIVAGKEERALISPLRSGGVVFMDVDNPGPRTEERRVTFLGIDMPPHYFPFELALKYRASLFFCLFEKDPEKPYRFLIVPGGAFSSADEGFWNYAASVEKRILYCPFMWSFASHFSAMFGEAAQSVSSSVNP